MGIEIEDATATTTPDDDDLRYQDYYEHDPETALQVACALVGNDHSLFEIFVDVIDDERETYYYVNRVAVDKGVYRLALTTQDLDRYCHNCATSAHVEGDDALPQKSGGQGGEA